MKCKIWQSLCSLSVPSEIKHFTKMWPPQLHSLIFTAEERKLIFTTKSVYKLFKIIVKVSDWLCFSISGPVRHVTLFLLKLSPSTPTLRIFPSLLACLPSSLPTVLLPVLCHITSITLRSPTTRVPCKAVCTFPQTVLSTPEWPSPTSRGSAHRTLYASGKLLRICDGNLLALWRVHSCAQNLPLPLPS